MSVYIFSLIKSTNIFQNIVSIWSWVLIEYALCYTLVCFLCIWSIKSQHALPKYVTHHTTLSRQRSLLQVTCKRSGKQKLCLENDVTPCTVALPRYRGRQLPLKQPWNTIETPLKHRVSAEIQRQINYIVTMSGADVETTLQTHCIWNLDRRQVQCVNFRTWYCYNVFAWWAGELGFN